MAEPDAPPPPGPVPEAAPRGRGLRIALFVSLALNLAVVGVVAGTLLDGRDRRPPPERLVRELGLGPYLAALGESDRGAMHRGAQHRRHELRASRGALRAAFGETLEALRAEPLDLARLDALLSAQAAAANRGRALGQELLLARVAAMSPAERAAFADRLADRLHRHSRP